MPANSPSDQQTSTVISKISALVGLYAIFVYLSGWTFLDYYYRTFGIYTRWFEISIPETLLKGFVILFEGGQWLWVVYAFILLAPTLEAVPYLRAKTWAQLIVAAVMLVCLPITYKISKSVGITTARQNQSLKSALPDIRLVTPCGTYIGRLLLIKNESYYVHDLQVLSKNVTEKVCLEPTEIKTNIHTLTVLRAEHVRALEIDEY